MKEEAERMGSNKEGVMDTLKQAQYRADIDYEANQKVDTLTFKQVFSELKREEELNAIAKLILPQSLKIPLLSQTLSSQLKKKEKSCQDPGESTKRRGEGGSSATQKSQLPHYDYDNRFNYRKGYLREDKVPAFISTALNQKEKKKEDIQYMTVGGNIDNISNSVKGVTSGNQTNRQKNVASTSVKSKQKDITQQTSRVKSRVINLVNSNESSPALRQQKGSATVPNN